MPTEYVILQGFSFKELERKVEEFLKAQYTLQGGVAYDPRNTMYLQAMVK